MVKQYSDEVRRGCFFLGGSGHRGRREGDETISQTPVPVEESTQPRNPRILLDNFQAPRNGANDYAF